MSAAAGRDAAEVARELAALRDGAALSPLSDRAVLLATGSDRTSFLQGMLSNDVARLADGQGTYALLLTEQGRVVADAIVLALADATWIEAPAAARERIRAALERFVVADDVEFEEPALHGVALRGPRAADVLGAVLPEHAAALGALGESAHLAIEHAGNTVRVVRARDHGRDGFHLWSTDATPIEALSDALLAAGAVSVSPDADALEVDRITTGWARDGVDYDPQTLAAEIPSFGRAVSYRKGCYLGQEVMERIAARGHVNWLLVRLTGEPASSFSVGAVVKDGAAEVGKVTSVAVTPDERRTIALARIRAAAAEPGRQLTIEEEGRATPVAVATIPVEG